jgi:hypothetical protein
MYVVERWLARLGRSPYLHDFVLKGGMLLASFGSRRPTVDADALARNMSADHETVAARVCEIAALADPADGVEFLTDTVTTTAIRDDALYSGIRVVMAARIATAEIKLRLDINFGDPVTPEPGLIELSALRPDTSSVHVLGYPVETVLAEKLATAIELGPANTRVRDWVDIYVLTGTQSVNHSTAREALQATADFRHTTLIPLSSAIGTFASLRAAAYAAYRRNLGPDGDHLPQRLAEIVDAVIVFADPLVDDANPPARWNPLSRHWESAAL